MCEVSGGKLSPEGTTQGENGKGKRANYWGEQGARAEHRLVMHWAGTEPPPKFSVAKPDINFISLPFSCPSLSLILPGMAQEDKQQMQKYVWSQHTADLTASFLCM